MYPSDNYRKLMIPFYYSERQRNQMINEKCDIITIDEKLLNEISKIKH